MKSVWEIDEKRPAYPALERDISTDVLIIGGGLAGILSAYMLDCSGIDCVIAEADVLCGGITAKTTAKISYQHGLFCNKMINRYGEHFAKAYLDANREAIGIYRDLSENIDCDFEESSSGVYSLTDKRQILNEVCALKRLGYSAEFANSIQLPFTVAGAVICENQAQFNPLKFAYAVSDGLQIYCGTRVRKLYGTTALTDKGYKIKASKVIVATHFPFLNLHGGYYVKMYQHRSYVIAVKGAESIDRMYIDTSKTGMSFRQYGDLLLIGGDGHRTGKKSSGWKNLEAYAKRHYPDSTVEYRWATEDCMTLDGIPYIGSYSAGMPGVYVATGFNKWGMTSSMVAAMILCDEVRGKKNSFSQVFSPSRSFFHPQLAVNAFEAITGLLTPSAKRCPHLGCALKWNRSEHTWDCPCHGSRFTESGKLIDNPATGDLKRNR